MATTKQPVKVEKDLDEKYKKHELRSHIYSLPDTYIGSIEPSSIETYVFNDTKKKMEKRELIYIQGLYKIYDEIIVNAIDQSMRLKTEMENGRPDIKPLKTIRITIDRATGYIEVMNDGDGIDVEMHPTYNVLIPELIFGELLTSTNYNAEEERLWGGRNGYGSKLTNIFSKEFNIETVDHRRNKMYQQRFYDNMKSRDKAKVKASTKTPYTKIRFLPDYERFGLKGITNDTYDLFRRRAFDVCATTDPAVSVYFNDQKLEIKDFEKYADLYLGTKDDHPRVYETCGEGRWEVVATYSENGQFDQVSFVNGINTIRGGKHVDQIVGQITKKLSEMVTLKKKKDIKPQYIRDNLMVFVKALIVNPSFDSQTKETLTTQASKFGSKCDLSDKFYEKLYKTGLGDKALSLTEFHENKQLKKTDGKKTSRVLIPNLDDANRAGTKDSAKCTLILTEGLSAKTMAISGLSVVGRDYYGVFPLKGKILNVKDAAIAKITANEEITNLKKILGLEQGKVYTDMSSLRYGKIMALCDSDVDGSHIKGLLFNVFQSLWPSLYKTDGFLVSMLTPIVKALNTSTKEAISFYNLTDYENWKQRKNREPNGMRNWRFKYYKGLGTSTDTEAKEYFKEMHEVFYKYNGKPSDESIDLAFNKKRADDRKGWLMNYNRQNILDYSNRDIPYEDFVNKELIHFSNRDLERSIPNLCDGLKESTRKIMFGCFKRKLYTNEIRVAQLSGYVSEVSAYHHGEASLQQAIIGMAQQFVGANNINLLQPNGQFGCLDPNTPILMWNGDKKIAKDIKIGDILVGDDGTPRNVLKTTSGRDQMYKINMGRNGSYIVNSQHILTLRFTMNGNIYWKNSEKCWRSTCFDNKTNIAKEYIIHTKESTKNNHFNASTFTREEAFEIISEKVKKINTPKTFDIRLDEYMSLPNNIKNHMYSVHNSSCIQWDSTPVPIDPYIFGCWIGDGNKNGTGITSCDIEILQAFCLYYDSISCELAHDPNYTKDDKIKEGYHFTVRRREAKTNFKTSIGDPNHSPESCIGCITSGKNHKICSWKYEKTAPNPDHSVGVAINGMRRTDMNPWKLLLKKYDLFNNKHIPEIYIKNDEDTRMKILAGIIDTDGTVKYNGGIPFVEVSQSERLHANIITSTELIANSLGFITSIYRRTNTTLSGKKIVMLTLRIYGNGLDKIPTRVARKKIIYKSDQHKDPYNSSFKVEALGEGEFYGWQTDGNERFLLGDFTITHNSRLVGGGDSASPRYIHTLLSPLARIIYREEDNTVLRYMDDDGIPVEPEYYIPIIPMILVNGGIGIGTGFSTNIPNYNPTDITRMCQMLISSLETNAAKVGTIDTQEQLAIAYQVVAKTKLPTIRPWYLGFKGIIQDYKDNSYQSRGVWKWVDDQTVEINELPICVWTDDYKEMLINMITNGSAYLKDFSSHYTPNKVKFILYLYPNVRAKLEPIFETEFKMISSKNLGMNNIHLYGADGAIRKFKDTQDIVQEWAKVRLLKYYERKRYQLRKMEADYKIIGAKVRFIQDIIDKKVNVMNQKQKDVDEQLTKLGYPKISDTEESGEEQLPAPVAEAEGGPSIVALPTKQKEADYNYLTRMPINQLTYEKKSALEKEAEKLKMLIRDLKAKAIYTIWNEELQQFSKEWESFKTNMDNYYDQDDGGVASAPTIKRRPAAAPAPKKK